MNERPAAPITLSRSLPVPERLWFRLRFAVYLLAVAGLFQALVLLIPRFTYGEIVPEAHAIEFTQLGLLVLTTIGLLTLAFRHPPARELYILLISFCLLAMIRELDYTEFYRNALRRHWMKWAAAIGFLGVVIFSIRRNLFAEIRLFLTRPSINLFILGLLLVVAWAQVLSQEQIWDSRADRLVEEALELAGYFLIFCGVLEEHLAVSTMRATIPPVASGDQGALS